VLEFRAGRDLGSAYRIDRFAECGGQVELVEGHRRVRQVRPDPGDERGTHIGAGVSDVARVAAVVGQVSGEASHRVRVSPVGGEDHPAGVEVSEEA
jgi:hypothetical protein